MCYRIPTRDPFEFYYEIGEPSHNRTVGSKLQLSFKRKKYNIASHSGFEFYCVYFYNGDFRYDFFFSFFPSSGRSVAYKKIVESVLSKLPEVSIYVYIYSQFQLSTLI